MIPARIEGCTRALGAPIGWNPEKSGICGVLPIRDEMNGNMPAMVSAWEPTPAELAVLANGGKVYLRVLGEGHPPVWVYALGPGDPDTSSVTPSQILHALKETMVALAMCEPRTPHGAKSQSDALVLARGLVEKMEAR